MSPNAAANSAGSRSSFGRISKTVRFALQAIALTGLEHGDATGTMRVPSTSGAGGFLLRTGFAAGQPASPCLDAGPSRRTLPMQQLLDRRAIAVGSFPEERVDRRLTSHPHLSR